MGERQVQQISDSALAEIEQYGRSSMPRQDKTDLHRWQLDTTDIIYFIEHTLKGDVYNEGTALWEKRYRQIINDVGLNEIMICITSHLNKNITLSNLSEDAVNRLAKETTADVINKLGMGFGKWGLDFGSLNTVVYLIDHNIYAMLQRAKNGTTLQFLQTTQRFTEHYNVQDTNKSQEKKWWQFPSFTASGTNVTGGNA